MSTHMSATASGGSRGGFTFLESLAALVIIALAVLLLVPAFSIRQLRNKKLAVRTEVEQVKSAWEQYLDRYKQWPTNTDDSVFTITGRLARILSGEDIDGANTAKVSFMEFSNMDASTNPISPWAASNCFYYCRFDHDYDGIIRAGGVTNLYPAGDMPGRVIVWVTNIFAQPGDTNLIFASWLR